MSPRIAWFSFLRFLRSLSKLAVLLAVLVGIGFGVRKGIQAAFHENPDFRLQAINLNPNDVLDEIDLVEFLEIDLAANIFDFDLALMKEELMEIPAVSAAKVQRHLPGTLEFEIETRDPLAWMACADDGFPAGRQIGALLIDRGGHTYPCPPRQLEAARELPIIHLDHCDEHPLSAGVTLGHGQLLHCLRLLDALARYSPIDISQVESLSQPNEWSIDLETRSGTVATFSLGDHERQISYLGRALHHAHLQGYAIATINLIPKQNVPITLMGEPAPPRAIPVAEPSPQEIREQRLSTDLNSLLNRS